MNTEKIQYEITITDNNRPIDVFEVHRQLEDIFGNCKMILVLDQTKEFSNE